MKWLLWITPLFFSTSCAIGPSNYKVQDVVTDVDLDDDGHLIVTRCELFIESNRTEGRLRRCRKERK